MSILKKYNVATSQWEPIVTGVMGPTGPTGPVGATGDAGPTGATGTVNLDSPAFTGTPTAPTATAATNTTQLATTAFVRTEVANLVASAPAALDTLDELAAALGDDVNFATTTATAIGLKAPIASPTFTGTVTIPTGASITAPTGLVKGDVGLGNADNTSDVNKPVSTAQQTALNLKANLANPTFTGTLNAAAISASDTISSTNRGEFTTSVAAGRGVGIKAPVGDATPGILQFTNNAQSAQWASIAATNNVLTINVGTSNFIGDVKVPNTSNNFFGSANGSNFWRPMDTFNNSYFKIGTGSFYADAANYFFRNASSANRLTISDTLTTIGTASITLGGVGTNAVAIPYLALDFNRLWDTYPGIMISNDTTWGPVGEFRVHGYGGPSGGDFGINFRIDGTYLTVSDGRMKKDISTINEALETVKNLRGVKYRRMNRELETDISETSITDGVKYGFVAQEIMEHSPEVVFQTPNHEALENGWADEFAVDYGGLTPLLVEAIKELEIRLSALEGNPASISA